MNIHTKNNYINKLSRFYIEQRNYLSSPLVLDHILSYFHKANRADTDKAAFVNKQTTLIRQLLQELPDLGLLCLQKCLKASL